MAPRQFQLGGELLAHLLNERGRSVGCAALGQVVSFGFPNLIER